MILMRVPLILVMPQQDVKLQPLLVMIPMLVPLILVMPQLDANMQQ